MQPLKGLHKLKELGRGAVGHSFLHVLAQLHEEKKGVGQRRHRHQFSAVQGAAVEQVGPRHSGSGHTYGTDRCIQQQDLWTACGNTTHSRTASENSHTSTPAAAQANPPPMKCIVVSWLLLSRTVNAASHPLPFVMQTRIVRGMCGIYAAFCSERGPEETSSQGSI